MRLNEFVQEAKVVSQFPVGYYAVGDSNAASIGSSPNWQSFAQQGATSSSSLHQQAIDRIPKGSVVAISIGGDEAVSGGDPIQVGSRINSIVQSAKQKGLHPVFVLFPRQSGENAQQGDILRAAIFRSVSAPMLDMQSAGTVADPGAIAKQIQSKFVIPGVTSQTMPTKSTPSISSSSAIGGKAGSVLDLIARFESRGNYNIILGGKNAPLTTMTLNQVFDLQRQMLRSGKESSAVGRYQYVGKTLRPLVKEMGLDASTTLFNERTQDQIAIYDLKKRCKLNEWLAGRINDAEFLSRISKVWASIPNPRTGKSTYAGVGSNKALISAGSALGTLQNIRMA